MHLFDSTITECALDSPGADDAHPRRPPNFPRASERELEDVSATEATGIRPGPDTPHTFSPPRIPRDRVAPKGLDPRAATRPHRFAAQSRMTIAPPPPTQPSRAARSSSSGARGGGSERPISARSSYAASNLGHVIGGRRFFVSLAVAVEQRRSRGSGRFVSHDPSLSLFDLRKDESLRPLPILYPQPPHHSASLVPFRGTETERSSSHLRRASTNSWACFPLPVALLHALPVSHPLQTGRVQRLEYLADFTRRRNHPRAGSADYLPAEPLTRPCSQPEILPADSRGIGVHELVRVTLR